MSRSAYCQIHAVQANEEGVAESRWPALRALGGAEVNYMFDKLIATVIAQLAALLG